MIRRIAFLILSVFLLANVCGCFLLLAGAAGGAGTAVWLSGKLVQEVNYPFERSVSATRSALNSLKLEITKETIEKNVAQLMGKYSDGKTVWVDIRKITELSSKIEVRVGAVSGDKAAAEKILKRITQYL